MSMPGITGHHRVSKLETYSIGFTDPDTPEEAEQADLPKRSVGRAKIERGESRNPF